MTNVVNPKNNCNFGETKSHGRSKRTSIKTRIAKPPKH